MLDYRDGGGVAKAIGAERTARVLLVGCVLSACYADFWAYRAAGLGLPGVWDDLLQGRGAAPEQYRIGVVWVAKSLAGLWGWKLPAVLAGIDALCGVVAVLVLLRVFERAKVFRRAEPLMQWFGTAAFVVVTAWPLAWLLWLQKPETLPTAMFVAAMVGLWQERPTDSTGAETTDAGVSPLWRKSAPPVEMTSPYTGSIFAGSTSVNAVGLVGLSLGLAAVRADVAVVVNVGVLLWAATRPRPGLALGRAGAIMTSAAGGLLAGGVQLWLMRVAYPQASYGRVKLWQLLPNLRHASRWPAPILFCLPLAWMAWQVGRRRGLGEDGVGMAMLLAGAIYAVLWVTVGKVDEVRIFLPMALALAPLTAEMAMLKAESRE
jgi:hypothetical protein